MKIENSAIDTLVQKYYQGILTKSQRIFTALDRDPDSPTFGCFDRDFWHYKIRDFSSMVLYQAALTTDTLYNWNNAGNIYYQKEVLKQWVDGSLNHWCNEQLKNGSFNEYYPFEQGYPPTVFSLYTTALLILDKGYDGKAIIPYIEKTCEWILNNPEKEASNQEAIGISAVYLSSKIKGVKLDSKKLTLRLTQFLNSQDSEGWFPEYNGPDIGYLSVTIDALWDYFRYSKDERALDAMKKATDFISLFFANSKGNLPVMINSRNTDYIVPYGIFSLAAYDNTYLPLLYKVLNKITEPNNYLETTDDRYLCHYVYTSSTRAVQVLNSLESKNDIIIKPIGQKNLKNCGIIIKEINNYTLYVNTKKGGILYLYDGKNLVFTNHGFRYSKEKEIAVTHWLTEDNEIEIITDENSISILIEGKFVSRKWLVPTPLKHTILRAISYTIGRKIIPLLKRVFIFGDKKLDISFSRKIEITNEQFSLSDEVVSNDTTKDIKDITESSYYSLRHVSSAFRFTPDELLWRSEKYPLSLKRGNEMLTSNITIGFDAC